MSTWIDLVTSAAVGFGLAGVYLYVRSLQTRLNNLHSVIDLIARQGFARMEAIEQRMTAYDNDTEPAPESYDRLCPECMQWHSGSHFASDDYMCRACRDNH